MNQYFVTPETPSDGDVRRGEAFVDSRGSESMVRSAANAAERGGNMVISAPHWPDDARVVVRRGDAIEDVIAAVKRLDGSG